MGINLQKGQKIDLTKGGNGSLRGILVGLGWDEVQQRGGYPIDCDASCITCGPDGKALIGNASDLETALRNSCVYFGNLRHPSGAIMHQGDNLTGEGDGDDEQIIVDLPRIPPYVDKLVFVVNIYEASKRGQHFGMIRNAFIRLVDMDHNTEICRFNLSENYNNMQGLVVGEIYRRNGEWKFNAIGQPMANASYIGNMLNLYL